MNHEQFHAFSEDLLDLLLDRSPLGVAILDERGYIQCANQGLARLTCIPERHLVSRPALELLAVSTRDQFAELMDRAEEEGSAQSEVSMLSLDGVFHAGRVDLQRRDGQILLVFEADQPESISSDEMAAGLETAASFYEHLTLEMYRSSRYHRPLGLLKCSMDSADELRAEYGEKMAQRLNSMVAWWLRKYTRRSDVVSRLTEWEYGILLPETDLAGALGTAQKLSDQMKTIMVETTSGKLSPTVSFGALAVSDAANVTRRDLMLRLDQALSAAASAGPGGIEADSAREALAKTA